MSTFINHHQNRDNIVTRCTLYHALLKNHDLKTVMKTTKLHPTQTVSKGRSDYIRTPKFIVQLRHVAENTGNKNQTWSREMNRHCEAFSEQILQLLLL